MAKNHKEENQPKLKELLKSQLELKEKVENKRKQLERADLQTH